MQYAQPLIKKISLISLVLGLLLTLSAFASPIKIGITEAEPFAMKDAKGKWTGISVELWETIAKDLGIEYEYIQLSLNDNIHAVANGTIQLSMGALSITSARELILDFSHPYYTSGLGIISRQQTASVKTHLINFAKPVAILLVFIVIGGILILIFENGTANPDFKLANINNGVWWSIVTITTTGYGDLVPKTKLGRLFASVWMITGALAMPVIISSISVNTTLEQHQQIVDDEDALRQHTVGVIKNTSTEVYFINNNIPYTTVDNINHMLDLLDTNQLEAGVYDKPLLQYKAQTHSKLTVSPAMFNLQYYGFALSKNSDFRKQLNLQILEKISTRNWQTVLNHYLGK